MSWILIAHHDEDLRRVIGRALKGALAPIVPKIEEVENLEKVAGFANRAAFDDCAVVIIGSTTPQDDLSSVGMTGRDPTLYLLNEIKRRWPQLPLVVVANTPNDRLADFLYEYETTALVTVDAGFFVDTLLAHLKGLRSSAHPPLWPFETSGVAPGPSAAQGVDTPKVPSDQVPGDRLQLDIHLGKRDLSAPWHLKQTGVNGFTTAGILVLNGEHLEDVLNASNRLEEDVALRRPGWLRDMGHLSNTLRKLLFQTGAPNLSCWEVFLKQRERVGGIANTRVCVTLNERTHPMLVEALRDQVAEDDDYWMLSAPVFRRYELKEPNPALFADQAGTGERINCLVIEADNRSSEAVADIAPEEELDALAQVYNEARNITRSLRAVTGIKVERMQLGRTSGDVRQRVLRKLSERQWHVVHFCGHTVGSGAKDAGLVLRACPDGILPVRRLIESLRKTQLLFLSSCRSGSAKIVFNAVEQHVPAVIGFRWVIDDRRAAEFAMDFYRILFDKSDKTSHRCIEYAFMRARRAAYLRDKERIAAEMERERGAAERKRARQARQSGGQSMPPSTFEEPEARTMISSDPSWAAPVLVIQSGDTDWSTHVA